MCEDQQEDEEVIDAERFFDQVAGQKLLSVRFTQPIVYSGIEQQGDCNQDTGQPQRLFSTDRVGLAFENPEIQD